MLNFPRKYIVDEKNNKIAVQLDIGTFEKIEEVLENYGLVKLIKETGADEKYALAEAKAAYKMMEKKP
jgi:rubrerythrin